MPLLVVPAVPAGTMRTLGQPTIEVPDGLLLRPWRPDDAPTVRAAFGCPDIQRWHVRRLDSDEEALAWVGSWADRWAAESAASWAVAGTDDRAVGQVGLRTINLFEGGAQLSYWVRPADRGAGVAVRATRALTRWAFDVLGLHRMGLMHSTANLPSCRVATKAAYPLEGTLRGYLRHADGFHDTHLHARLRTDG